MNDRSHACASMASTADLPNPADTHHKHEPAKEEHSGTNGGARVGDAGAASPPGGTKGGVKAMLSSFVEVCGSPTALASRTNSSLPHLTDRADAPCKQPHTQQPVAAACRWPAGRACLTCC